MSDLKRDVITSLRLKAKEWEDRARDLGERAGLAMRELKTKKEPPSVRTIRAVAANYQACALDLRIIIEHEESLDLRQGIFDRAGLRIEESVT